MPEPMLTISGLDAFYGDFQALFGLNLAVHEGEVLAIIGANGAGKTTLLRSIAGLIRNRAEDIRHRGRPIGALRADQVTGFGIALVPEGRQLFPSLSVEENLVLAADVWRIRGAERERRLQETWSRFEALANARHRAARTLSGGQQQQLAIARALLAAPRVLILAEPSSGLSPLAWSLVRDACRAAATEGRIVLVAEQRLRLAAEVADRCALLHSGRVSFEGPTEVALERALATDYFGLGDA